MTVADELGSFETVINGIVRVLDAFDVIALIAAGLAMDSETSECLHNLEIIAQNRGHHDIARDLYRAQRVNAQATSASVAGRQV